jgi:hypothetical protein
MSYIHVIIRKHPLAEVLEEYNFFPCFFFSIPKQGTVATTNKNPRYFQVKHVLTNSIHFSTNLSHILSVMLYYHFKKGLGVS